jgi:pyruvate carboxylase subunit B
MKKHIETMVTAFRDGFQSVYGARVFTDDFIPAVEVARDAGIRHFEAGGGARFQSLYFYCNEDAFTMMDRFREAAGPDANLQTLARGVNVVGLDSQSRDIIKLHAELFKKHGISTIRNFDALNDVNNLIYSGQCIHDAGLNHEVSVTMMELPPGTPGAQKAHTPEFYMKTLKDILDANIPFSSVCFKDASGTSAPQKVYETIKQARAMLGNDVKIVFHSHETAGTGVVCYKAAIEAGANQIDLSMAPTSGGTGQTDIITMWHALRGTEYDLGFDIKKILHAEEVFKECMKDYFMPPEARAVEPLIPFSPMPGGALTANTQMMRDNNILDRYDEVISNMGEVVKLGGFGTSVTPVSQFYFQQAFNNTMFGPWKKIAEGYGKMVLGYFGKTPFDPDPMVVKEASEQLGLEPTTRSPLDINDEDPEKGRPAAEAELKLAGLPITDENVFIAATCKEKGIQFLQGKGQIGVRKKTAADKTLGTESSGPVKVVIGGNSYVVDFTEGKAMVNGKKYDYKIEDHVVSSSGQPSEGGHRIESPMPGLVLKIEVESGQHVEEGQVLMILEAMKMETEIHAPGAGTIGELPVAAGDQVTAGALLAIIR